MESENRTKVVQLSSVHHSLDTRIFYKVSKSLKAKGYDVDLIVQHPTNEIKDGINIIGLPVAQKKLDRFLKVIPSLFRKCLDYPSETIFHFHDPELMPVGFLLKSFGYKVIYDVHEDVPKDIKSKEWIPAPFRKILSWLIDKLEWFAVKTLDRVIVVTSSIQKRLDSEKTHLVQNFPILVDGDGQSGRREKADSSKVFYIGDITLIRGIKEIVQSMEIVNDSADLECILGGKFSPPVLKDEISNMPGWKYINFVGWIERNEFEKFANEAIAGLVLFHPEPNHIDAQPNKLFEYMLAGLPVVASDFPLWREIVEKNKCGILVDPLSPGEISEAILWLKDYPEKAIKMGENGRRAVLEKYNWNQEVKKLIAVYNSLA